MNNWYGIGRLTKEPEVRFTKNEKAVCDFTIAIDRPKQKDKDTETDFISCQIWGKQAENLGKYQKKGSLIAINGTLRVDNYENEKGERRYKTYVLVSNIEYLTPKKNDAQEVNKVEDPFKITDSDLPF